MSAWVQLPDGDWRHRPWWKVAINTVLRLFQPWPRKFVVYTICKVVDGDPCPPSITGYGAGFVLHEAKP